jgi:pyruvate formate lyase activating enzyme
MNGLVFDIKRFSIHDGPGIRTTVFFKGCPLRCDWCHNPESRACQEEEIEETERIGELKFNTRKKVGRQYSIDELLNEVLKDRVFYDESCGGVTCSGGEPLSQADFLIDFLKVCKNQDLHTAIDTSGYAPWKEIEKILPWSDLILYDIKHIDSSIHQQYTGKGNKLILDNFNSLIHAGIKTIVRIPVVPGVNDSEDDISRFISFLVPRKNINFNEINLLPYHNTGKGKYLKMNITPAYQFNEPGDPEVQQIADRFLDSGFLVKIGG